MLFSRGPAAGPILLLPYGARPPFPHPPAMTTDNHPLRGTLLLVGAVFCFALLDASAKHLALHFPVPLLAWTRYVVHCLLMALFLAPRLGRRLVATGRPTRQIVRALLLVGSTAFGMAALARMPLAETTATIFVAPLLVALLAGPWLGERLPASRWIVVGLGFVGVLLIARPGGEISGAGLAFALAGAGCYTFYQLLTRQLTATENTLTLLFYTAWVGSVAMTLALPWYGSATLQAAARATPGQWLHMASLGLFGGAGHFLLIRAFRYAPASLLSPFLYLQLVWATLLGILVFGHWPDTVNLLGMGIIVGCGLFLALPRGGTAPTGKTT